jgi:tryptophanyl-tRNA synthetase
MPPIAVKAIDAIVALRAAAPAFPRSHPPRAVIVVASSPFQIADWGGGSARHVLDLQHEYPAEAFYAIDDGPLDARREPEACRRAALSVATGCLAFGLQSNKVVLFRQSELPQTHELLWSLRQVSPRPLLWARSHDRGGDGELPMVPLIVDDATMFAATCLVLRATTIAAHRSQMAGYQMACRIADRWRGRYAGYVLPHAALRLFDNPCSLVEHIGGACRLSPLLTRSELAGALSAIWDAGARAGGLPAVRRCWTRTYGALVDDRRSTETFADQLGPTAAAGAAALTLGSEISASCGAGLERYRDLLTRPDYVRDVLREGRVLAVAQASLTVAAIRRATGEGDL